MALRSGVVETFIGKVLGFGVYVCAVKFVVSKYNGSTMNISRFSRWIMTCNEQICFPTPVLFSRILLLALLDCFCGADDGRAGCYGGDYSKRHDDSRHSRIRMVKGY